MAGEHQLYPMEIVSSGTTGLSADIAYMVATQTANGGAPSSSNKVTNGYIQLDGNKVGIGTDANVSQSSTTTASWRKVILSYQSGSEGAAVSSNTNVVYGAVGIEAQPSTGTLKATVLRASGNNLYVGSAANSQCHQQYDTTNKCLKFIFD